MFTTRELPVLAQSVLVRRGSDKKLQPFSRDRLFLSIFEVCKHRGRAIVESGALTETIMAIVLKNLHDGVVERDLVAHTANTVLNRFDSVAAGLYAAYHPIIDISTEVH